MDNNKDWNETLTRLGKLDSLNIVTSEIGRPATNDDFETLRLLGDELPPAAILEFYKSSNGVKLLWNAKIDGASVGGSVNILPIIESCIRASADEDGEPLEGVLWDEEFPEKAKAELKKMSIFESISGRSAYLTYRFDKDDSLLFLVNDDEIKPIAPDFETTIKILKLYAGADSVRDLLTFTNWEERLQADNVLQKIAAL